MKSYNAALNVDCVFCHKGQVGKPWSTYDFTDTSKKRHETARLMMRTTNDLNEKFKELGDMDDPTKVDLRHLPPPVASSRDRAAGRAGQARSRGKARQYALEGRGGRCAALCPAPPNLARLQSPASLPNATQ